MPWKERGSSLLLGQGQPQGRRYFRHVDLLFVRGRLYDDEAARNTKADV